MTDICPTITAADTRTYHVQMEQVSSFIKRIHIDLSDGILAPHKLVPPEHIWWPAGISADLHVMYQQPLNHLEAILNLDPSLIIVHAEAEGDFYEFASQAHDRGIKVGVALLPATPVSEIAPALHVIDHVLIFSGKIGYFGGHADLKLLAKVHKLRELKPELEIGWDGGINDENAGKLAKNGVDVLNAGGFIHGAINPSRAYARLERVVKGTS